MGRKKLEIDKEQLAHLYLEKNLSTYKIANVLGCTFKTIINRLREYNIPRKNSSDARNRYPKFNFDDDLIKKSYMLGFRLGDLNVYKSNELSKKYYC